ncbi:AbrB/MazE/SpoVT family DNA-binding domain-containing protein [Halorubrum sp. FL23]|uniref:AbrB/MazE/SpoVT family DNA-binding domain-containing protein n=1 Tax=Halorubrum sp. FL23 TaxID=3458704 RepID=UPI004034F57A
MTRVDSEGRVTLPQEVRERLNIEPGTEVEILEEDGKVVIEPVNSPDKILERMEQIISESSLNREQTESPLGESDPAAHKHKNSVQRQAENSGDE